MLRRVISSFVVLSIMVVAVTVGFLLFNKPIRPLTDEDVESLRLGFADFLTTQVEKKQKRKVSDLNINAIYQRQDGQVVIDYALVYNEEITGGERVTYEINALAAVENIGQNEWSITQVSNRSQALEFLEGETIRR